MKFCKTCRGVGKSIHEHSLKKFKVDKSEPKPELTKEEMLKKKLEEKVNFNYTDIVADMPVKFKYAKVKDSDFGLTDDMLLFLDDKTINKYVPLKGIVPYREDEYKINKFKIKKDTKILQKEIDRNKKVIVDDLKNQEDIIKSNTALIGRKIKKSEAFNENNARDKRRLESYGIVEDNSNIKK